jgi:hypothetical protein
MHLYIVSVIRAAPADVMGDSVEISAEHSGRNDPAQQV